MNKCFLIGKVIEIEKFRFILNSRQKSQIIITVKILDGNVVKVLTYDNMADYIWRGNLLNKQVLIQGRVSSKLYGTCVISNYIEEIKR